MDTLRTTPLALRNEFVGNKTSPLQLNNFSRLFHEKNHFCRWVFCLDPSSLLVVLRLFKKKIEDIGILVQLLQPLFLKRMQEEAGQRHLPGFAFLSRLLLRELTVSRTSVLKCCSAGLTPGPCSCKTWWKTRSASAILDSFWEASSAELGKSGKD